ncbi:MAG: hypothetical protein J7519_11590, partial [Roseofilum sp. SID1]
VAAYYDTNYEPEPLGGFGEGPGVDIRELESPRPRDPIEPLWKRLLSFPLGQPRVPDHTGHTPDNSLDNLIRHIFHSSAVDSVPDLTGIPRSDVENILKQKGFVGKKPTPGGYQQWKHADGSKIWIGPDLEIDRFRPKVQNPDPNKKGYNPRVDQYGKEIPNDPSIKGKHHTGEIIAP